MAPIKPGISLPVREQATKSVLDPYLLNLNLDSDLSLNPDRELAKK
jgi:hypothetical protein